MIRIDSPSNITFKNIKSLKERKYRDSHNQYIVEGLRIVEEALEYIECICHICISDTFYNTYIQYSTKEIGTDLIKTLDTFGSKTILMPDKLFKDICDTKSPQGILSVMKKPSHSLPDILPKLSNSLIVLLESVQDPGNMGSIIRTADAAGACAIILSDGCVDIFSPKVIRSTMGSIFHIPIINSSDFHSDILKLKAKKTKIFATHLNGQSSLFETDLVSELENTCIIIGNEANGISDKSASIADNLVLIPMFGKAESLNASAAAAITIYEVLRQKTKKTNKNVLKSP